MDEAGVTCFEDEGRGPEPRNVGGPQELEKTGTQILPQSLQKECSPVDLFQTLTSRTVW